MLRPLLLSRDDRRMHNAIEIGEAILAKGKISKETALKAAVSIQNLRTEVPHDGLINLLAGLHKLAADRIGFENMTAQHAEEIGHGSLSATQSPGQAHPQHRCYPL